VAKSKDESFFLILLNNFAKNKKEKDYLLGQSVDTLMQAGTCVHVRLNNPLL